MESEKSKIENLQSKICLQSIQVGTIGTIAGAGEPGWAGDAGPATAALLNEPKNVALDAAGNLYVADSENHVIRKVDAHTGIIQTIAGTVAAQCHPERSEGSRSSAAEPMADLADDEDPLADPVAQPGAAYTQQPDLSGMVRYVSGAKSVDRRFSGDGGPATHATLNFPSAVAVADDGTLYIADTWNHRIRRVDPHTAVISTIAGTGRARWSGDGGPAENAALNEPVALTLDGWGRLYVADQSNNRVRRIDLTSGLMTTVVGTGESGYNGDGSPGTETALAGPSGLAVDRDGSLYVADTFNSRIRKFDVRTGMLETVVGGTGEFQFVPGENEASPNVSRPYAIALHPDGRLFITDTDHHLIRIWDFQKREMSLLAGNGRAEFSGDGRHPLDSSLNYPFGVALDFHGRVYIADTFSHRIRVIVHV